MRLVINNVVNGHVSLDTVDEFEQAIQLDADVKPAKQLNRYTTWVLLFIYKMITKFELPNYYHFKPSSKISNRHLFVVMMGFDIIKSIPYFLIPHRYKSIYLFDAWTQNHEHITQFANLFDIDYIFVSSSQAAELLNTKLKRSNVYWIPEGINHEAYKYFEYEKKNIDVLALGRRFEQYHQRIVGQLKANNKVYLYEQVKGEIIFPSREEFIEGLGRSKISICVPSSITHPARADEIETMTIRYLQSMVSKCLLLGHAPKEMVELFGYNPVVEIDSVNPVQQILLILDNFSEYIPMIEKNFQTAIQHHTWWCRWNQIKCIVNSESTC